VGGTELTENVCYFVSIISEFQAERDKSEQRARCDIRAVAVFDNDQ
jgi:hypothetical protein